MKLLSIICFGLAVGTALSALALILDMGWEVAAHAYVVGGNLGVLFAVILLLACPGRKNAVSDTSSSQAATGLSNR